MPATADVIAWILVSAGKGRDRRPVLDLEFVCLPASSIFLRRRAILAAERHGSWGHKRSLIAR
jgi:hypothetical protein